MENLLAYLVFISLVLLIIGFIKPNTSLFWYKKERTKKKSLVIYLPLTIILFILFGIVRESNKDPVDDIARSEEPVTQIKENKEDVTDQNDNGSEEIKKVEKEQISSIQDEFLNKKFELFDTEYINAGNLATQGLYPKKTESLTKKLLEENGSVFKDWTGIIDGVSLSYGSEKDIEFLKKGHSPKELIEKYPENRDLSVGIDLGAIERNGIRYSLIGIQERNYKTGIRGVQNSDKNFEKILSMEQGDNVIVSFKVISSKEYKSKIEQATNFIIKIETIRVI